MIQKMEDLEFRITPKAFYQTNSAQALALYKKVREFAALKKDADLVLICGAGGQAALAGKTLKEMGFQNVSNVGGFSAWKDAGGPVED